MRAPLTLLTLLSLAVPASAQNTGPEWLTTPWDLSETSGRIPEEVLGWSEGHFADLSVWLRDLGVPTPALRQQVLPGRNGEPAAARYRARLVSGLGPKGLSCGPFGALGGYVPRSTIAICLDAQSPTWSLMNDPARLRQPERWAPAETEWLSTFAHELFHASQQAYFTDRLLAPELKWVTEGTAEAVAHAWKARVRPDRYGRRHVVDPDQHRAFYARALRDTTDENVYGLGHFWYSTAELLAPVGESPVGVLAALIQRDWPGDGVATADRGLREVAALYNAPRNLDGGLYEVYPEVIATYTDSTHFAAYDAGDAVSRLRVGMPGYQTARALLPPLSSVAVFVDVDIDETALEGRRSVPVRLTLDVGGPVALPNARDQIHLIDGPHRIGRPALSTTPYAHVVEVTRDTTFFVRVANVAADAAQTAQLPFELRVEVEGFFGAADAPAATLAPASPLSGGDAGKASGAGPPPLSGELRPGFAVRGPGPWTCSGDRALFDVQSADERADDVTRIVPEMTQDLDNAVGGVEAAMRRLERAGYERILTPEEVEAIEDMNAGMGELLRQAAVEADLDGQAAEIRDASLAQLRATFVSDAAGCQLLLNADLLTREAGPGIVPGVSDASLYPSGEAPGFSATVLDRQTLRGIRGEAAPPSDPVWQACMMSLEDAAEARRNAGDCPAVICTPGRLNLERAADGQITGTFEFEVLRWSNPPPSGCHVPAGRDVVTGQFNVLSADRGDDDNALSIMAGAPLLD